MQPGAQHCATPGVTDGTAIRGSYGISPSSNCRHTGMKYPVVESDSTRRMPGFSKQFLQLMADAGERTPQRLR
ncbi:hypothetical protein CS238_16545 [Salmonella enterica]|nr:hypothetical protein [Salmonella enterica]EJC8750639.1 hypothetical protein [Salmonella enterica]HCM1650976.1 hypothetical protein [Salmonella enterica subsp. diarizonae serovar 48:i:z35]